VCLALSASGVARGIGLFLVLVAAVAVRETARLLVAAWLGLRLRAVLLLPIGGLFAYADPESQENANAGVGQFAIAFAGPLANWATALVLAAIVSGRERRYAPASISPSSHPLTCCAALVWMQVGLGVMHLLPAYPLDCGRLIRGSFARKHGFAPAGRAATAWDRCSPSPPWSAACCCTIIGWHHRRLLHHDRRAD
jgi:membrane-associated protease RseP (regulator of RpoE activity)